MTLIVSNYHFLLMKKWRHFNFKKQLFVAASLFALLFIYFGYYLGEEHAGDGKFKINIDYTEGKDFLNKSIDKIGLTPRRRSIADAQFGENATPLGSSSNSQSDSQIIAASYDLLSQPHEPNLHQMLQDYTRNRGSRASCKLKYVKLHTYMRYMKATALVSFPRSGNTWVRVLVEKSTGYRTSSIYCDPHLRVLQAECNRQNSFLIKTHEIAAHTTIRGQQKAYDQFIYLVRNPFDAILSYYQFVNSSGDHTLKSIEVSRSVSDRNLPNWLGLLSIEDVRGMVSGWYDLYSNWQNTRLPRVLIRYEDLKQSPGIILKYIRRFIVPIKLENDQSDTNENPPKFLYYFDHRDVFSSEKETMGTYIQQEDRRITCTVAEDFEGQDLVYETNRYELLHSLKYFSNETVAYIIQELREPLCYFKYDVFLTGKLKISCNHSLYANVIKTSFQ